MYDNFFEITCYKGKRDARLFLDVLGEGVIGMNFGMFCDNPESFEKSGHVSGHNRLFFSFHKSEIQLLLRRLQEIDTQEADSWVTDIVETYYGVELKP